MSSQSWVQNAVTDQHPWRPGTVIPPGHYLNPLCSPEENSGIAHPISHLQGHSAPGSAGSNLGGPLPISNQSAMYAPKTFTYWPSTNNHGPTFTPSQATPRSVVPQPDLPVNQTFSTLIPSQAAPSNEVPQAGTQAERSPSLAFPYTLPPPSPPPVSARPISVPPQQFDMFLPPPSPPARFAHLTRSSSEATLVKTKLHDPTEQSKDNASSSTLVRCHCCLRNPVNFSELGVNWCGECFGMVQSQRKR